MGRKSLVDKGKVTREQIVDLYSTQSLSVKAGAEILGISQGSFYNYLKRFGIARRSRGNRRSKATVPASAPTQAPSVDVAQTTSEEDPNER